MIGVIIELNVSESSLTDPPASEPPLARAPFPQLAWEKNLFISAPGTDQSYRTKQASELPL